MASLPKTLLIFSIVFNCLSSSFEHNALSVLTHFWPCLLKTNTTDMLHLWDYHSCVSATEGLYSQEINHTCTEGFQVTGHKHTPTLQQVGPQNNRARYFVIRHHMYKYGYGIAQGWAICGPQATCGPPRRFMRPKEAFSHTQKSVYNFRKLMTLNC